MGWGVQEGGGICILMADSCCCMAETNTTLESNYPPIKKFFKNIEKLRQDSIKQIHAVWSEMP